MTRREAIAALMTLPVATVKVAEVKPDDVLVIQCEQWLSLDAKARMSTVMSTVWPGRRVIVLDGGSTLQIARG